jgi:hypothetical protein
VGAAVVAGAEVVGAAVDGAVDGDPLTAPEGCVTGLDAAG